jgi:hypothetical protein
VAPSSTPSRTPAHADGVHVGAQTTPTARAAATTTPVVEAAVSSPAVVAGPVEMHLPAFMVSRTDVSRSLREVEALDDYFRQAAIRGSKDQSMPGLSRVLESFSTENGLNLLHGPDRDKAKKYLEDVKTHAPVVHVSFAAEASGEFLARLLDWFRKEAHPFVLLHVGLQPELAAGCMIRTTNKVFDFSFRARFESSKVKLVKAIEALQSASAEEVQAVAQAAVTDANAAVAAAQPMAAAIESAVVTSGTEAAPTTPVPVEGGVQ